MAYDRYFQNVKLYGKKNRLLISQENPIAIQQTLKCNTHMIAIFRETKKKCILRETKGNKKFGNSLFSKEVECFSLT